MSLGIIAVIVMQISLLASICCKFCRCEPHQTEENTAIINKGPRPRYNRLSYLFFTVAILTLLVVQVFFIGRSYITDGAHQSEDTVNYVSNVFSDLVEYGNVLSSYGVILENDFQEANAAGCQPAETLQSYIPTYYSYVNQYSDYVDPVPNQLSDVNDKISLWGIKYQNYTLWALYFVVILCLVLFGIGYWRKSKIIMKIGIGVAEIVVICLFIVVGIGMVILMGFADFCMDPVKYSLVLVPDDMYNVTSYYTTCSGVSPIGSVVTESESFLSQCQQAVADVAAACPNNAYINDAILTIQKAEIVLTNITSEIVCAPTQSEVVGFLQTSLCTQTFKGIYTIWIGQYFAASLLLLTTIVIAIIYQYFGAYWDRPDEPIQGNYYDYGDDGETGVSTTRIVNPAARQSPNGTDYNY
jgi:hypothetical protein